MRLWHKGHEGSDARSSKSNRIRGFSYLESAFSCRDARIHVNWYIDPGTFGVISQVGYVILFGVVSGVMLFFRRIRQWFRSLFSHVEDHDES